MYLVGDIGGTTTVLALMDKKGKRHTIKYYLSKESSFNDILTHFMLSVSHKPKKACFAVAGPVNNNVCKTTNLPWVLHGKRLAKKLRIPVTLINDFEAVGYGVFALKKKDVVQLNKARPSGEMAVVIGPGTGLGEAILYNGNVIPSEGGHSDLAARTTIECKLKQKLLRKGVASAEAVVSGPGIVNIFNFLATKIPKKLQLYLREDDPAAVISYQAIKNTFPVCVKTMKMFVTFYAREAQSLALKAKATKGVYLAGGISAKIIPLLKKWFMKEFTSNKKMKILLKSMPVFVVKHKEVGLLGAWQFIAR